MIVVEMGMRGLVKLSACVNLKPDWGLITNVGRKPH